LNPSKTLAKPYKYHPGKSQQRWQKKRKKVDKESLSVKV
jgi:hypothetical protein